MKNFQRNIALGIFIGLAVLISTQFFVKAVTPGTISNPTFGPTQDDVTSILGISCSWSGKELKRVDWNNDSDQACLGIYVTCENGFVTAINTGYMEIRAGSPVNGAACGNPVW